MSDQTGSIPPCSRGKSFLGEQRSSKISTIQKTVDETSEILEKIVHKKVEEVIQDTGKEKSIQELVNKTEVLAGAVSFSKPQPKPSVSCCERVARIFKKLKECMCCCCFRKETE